MSADKMRDAVASTDISTRLREYAGDPGYSHGDYADTMRAAAAEIVALERKLIASRGLSTEYFDIGLTQAAEIARLTQELEANAAPVQAQGVLTDDHIEDIATDYYDGCSDRLYDVIGFARAILVAQAPASDALDAAGKCKHDWPEDGQGTDIDGFCTKCGMSFQRYIHTEMP